MTDIKYAYKFESINDSDNSTDYKYVDCFTGDSKTVTVGDDNPFDDLAFESKMKIFVSGEWLTTTSRIDAHIIKLMQAREDNMQFTDLSIYLKQDDIVKCDIELSIRYMTVTAICDFVQTLINSTEDYGENIMELCFSRPDTDVDFFVINVKY